MTDTVANDEQLTPEQVDRIERGLSMDFYVSDATLSQFSILQRGHAAAAEQAFERAAEAFEAGDVDTLSRTMAALNVMEERRQSLVERLLVYSASLYVELAGSIEEVAKIADELNAWLGEDDDLFDIPAGAEQLLYAEGLPKA